MFYGNMLDFLIRNQSYGEYQKPRFRNSKKNQHLTFSTASIFNHELQNFKNQYIFVPNF